MLLTIISLFTSQEQMDKQIEELSRQLTEEKHNSRR